MPLNGTQIHPLSDHALGVLKMLLHKNMPAQEINPGVVQRLKDEGLIELVAAPSPYKKHSKFIKVNYAKITDAGRLRCGEAKGKNEQ